MLLGYIYLITIEQYRFTTEKMRKDLKYLLRKKNTKSFAKGLMVIVRFSYNGNLKTM